MANELSNPRVSDWRSDASESIQTHDSDLSALHTRRPAPAFIEQFPAAVRTSPCSSNASGDYTDARYYLDRAVATNTTSSALTTQTESLPGLSQCLTATNLAELLAGTHRLTRGTIVQVFVLYTRMGNRLYVFNQPPPDGAVVLISGAASGGGKYSGQLLTGDSTATSDGNLAMPEGLSTGANALILNEEENGMTGNRIAAGSYAVGEIAGNSNGTSIVIIRGGVGSTSGPTALSGSGTDPDSTSWSKASNATAVDVWVQTRTVWDPSTGTLFSYQRKLSFDARGVLYAASSEEQLTVAVATECS